jgi:hypothetical protein
MIYFTSIIPLASAIGAYSRRTRWLLSMMMFSAAHGVFLCFEISDFDVFVGILP